MVTDKHIRIINNLFSPKFMVTSDGNGDVNIAIISSLEYYKGKLVFGNLMLWKTARNLRKNPKVAVLAMDDNLRYFTIQGNFVGYEEAGEIAEHVEKGEMVRYNAYTGFRNAGSIEITNVSPVQKLPLPKMLLGYLGSRLRSKADTPGFPASVRRSFETLKSIRAVAYHDGDTHIVPVPAMGVDGNYLIPTVNFPEGARFAASVITTDIVAFQVKGTVDQKGLKVEEVYACGPPVPGKMIYSCA